MKKLSPTSPTAAKPKVPALIFDLDGTLTDSVYQHTIAWKEALEHVGANVPLWTIHRRIGMSGKLVARGLLSLSGKRATTQLIERVENFHTRSFKRLESSVRLLPGAKDLLAELSRLRVPWTIATSGALDDVKSSLKMLGIDKSAPIVTRDSVEAAKPSPDLFLAAAEKLGVALEDSIVVGDSVWDLLAARRAKTLGIGLLTGGYGREELERAGAYRVYDDPQQMLENLTDIGIGGD
jgi:HAD superfamily hydrolase (TIGR01549 family)